MIRTLLLLMIGYIIWTVFRLVQRSRRSGGGYDRVHPVDPNAKPKKEKPEIRDAQFEDIDPEK